MEVFIEWFSLLLQIWAAVITIGTACIITNPDNYYKSGQLLQIGAEQDGTKIIISDINLF